MKDITEIKCFVLDMDGTFYLGNRLIDGALDFLKTLKAQNKEFLFLTNNSSKNKYAYVTKLNNLGLDIEPNRIFTSGEATTIYLNSKKAGAKVFLLGTKMLEEEFINAGFKLVKDRSQRPDFIVLGFDTTLTYEKLWIACDFIRDGVEYVATHPDFNCPLEDSKFMPDAGAMIDFISTSTGKKPYVVGKPNKAIIEALCEKYAYDKEDIAIVGDRLYTDIKTGENAGITSILVLSGETSIESYNNSETNADFVYPSLKEINEELIK
ncbi:HAD-superfamily subfamily IIA hydrolase, TIGR01457 [Clostridium amylolyticum]|uniref:Acid sugar phosphatase n=1 Tax=Clostridium amylolyticum TaxID=1121298 RepID=A0A1M6N0D7_9CLOT|nr:HAD-IIA family hydrolase [Clostridium amylolyticum]SHJ89108.1 HAD-superfamily subfamily IIA hydrolase, TIGR01457 [Clostridium amylolyticum]